MFGNLTLFGNCPVWASPVLMARRMRLALGEKTCSLVLALPFDLPRSLHALLNRQLEIYLWVQHRNAVHALTFVEI